MKRALFLFFGERLVPDILKRLIQRSASAGSQTVRAPEQAGG